MASGTVYSAIEAYLKQNWTTTPIVFENKNTTEDGQAVPPDPELVPAWVEVEITGTVYGQQSIGMSNQANNRWDEEGVLFINVYVKSGTGSALARTYAKSLADMFRGTTLLSGSLEFLDAFIGKGQPGAREGNWYLVPVDQEWRRIDG